MTDNGETGTAAEGCIALLCGWVLGFGSGAVRAVVWMKGWEWFVVDTFGAPSLAFVEAWGLSVLVSFATMQLQNDQDQRRPYRIMAVSVLTSLVLSGFVFTSLAILAAFR